MKWLFSIVTFVTLSMVLFWVLSTNNFKIDLHQRSWYKAIVQAMVSPGKKPKPALFKVV